MSINRTGLRLLVIGLSLGLLAACASNDKTAQNANPMDQSQNTMPPRVDSGDVDSSQLDADRPQPGSQEDLIATAGSDRVFFAFDSAELSSDARDTLRRQADWMRSNSGVRVTIEGHCDERGTREYNLALGERRANAVRSYLVALGIEGGRLSTISYGKERPAVLGSAEDAWAKNRRAVMNVSGTPGT